MSARQRVNKDCDDRNGPKQGEKTSFGKYVKFFLFLFTLLTIFLHIDGMYGYHHHHLSTQRVMMHPMMTTGLETRLTRFEPL
jgi:hypothetical protein